MLLRTSASLLFASLPAVGLAATPARAGDPPVARADARVQDTVVHAIRVGELLGKGGEGTAALARLTDLGMDDLGRLMQGLALVRVEGGEGVFAFDHVQGGDAPLEWRLLVKSGRGETVKGELWLPAHDRDRVSGRLARIPFTLPADTLVVAAGEFDAAVKRHAALLAGLGIAGKPLFDALAEGAPPDTPGLPATVMAWRWSQPLGAGNEFDRTDFGRTFELFSGGRALQENLQTDRMRGLDGGGALTVRADSLEGITLEAIDWKTRVGVADPGIEPLATWVPADQIYVSFASFDGMVRLLDEMERRGDTLVRALEPRSEDAGTRARLERQIGLSTDAFARLLGPAVVRSVAFTASDPYLREGTDVAMLFDCVATQPLVLRVALAWKEARTAVAGCADVDVEHGGVRIRGVVSPDRRISSYLAVAGDVVILGNSRPSLERLIDAHAGALPGGSLGASDEFRFFRARYPFVEGTKGTTSGGKTLFVLSDPFLRRFCGPAWRIGESRRLRCAALQARLEGLRAAGATADAQTLATELGLACPGGDASARFEFVDGGARCSVHGGAGFLTPVSEVPVVLVSEAERNAYEQFRTRYQQYWRQYFDPIALEVELGDPIRVDMTVLPLIRDTDYAQMRDFATGEGVLTPFQGDAHPGTLLHLISHVNPDAELLRDVGGFVSTLPGLQQKGLGWLGDSVELFVEDGPFWDGLAQALQADRTVSSSYFEEHLSELPIAIALAIRNPLSFAGFVIALRAFAESSLPNQLAWETRQHAGLEYVVVKPRPSTESPFPPEMANIQLCYATCGSRFWVTWNEALLQRALERSVARANAALPADQRNADLPAPPQPAAWLGSHLAASLELARVRLLCEVFGTELSLPELIACYSNLPILDEWQRREPSRDPLDVHASRFAVRPVCPAGGLYQWDPELRAMSCSKHGHPTAPREPRELPAVLDGIARAAAGITFEEDGVRVRLEATRQQ